MTDSTVHVSKPSSGKCGTFSGHISTLLFLRIPLVITNKKQKKHGRVLYVHVAHCIVIVIRN